MRDKRRFGLLLLPASEAPREEGWGAGLFATAPLTQLTPCQHPCRRPPPAVRGLPRVLKGLGGGETRGRPRAWGRRGFKRQYLGQKHNRPPGWAKAQALARGKRRSCKKKRRAAGGRPPLRSCQV